MLAAPDKTNLPAHSRDVCPWGTSCPTHAGATFADQVKRNFDARHLPRKTLSSAPRQRKPCVSCGGARPDGLQLKKAGRTLRVCRPCHDNRHVLFGVGVPRALLRFTRQAVPA